MKAFLAALTLVGVMMTGSPALAADPSPSPKAKSLPIRGVTVDVQQMREQSNSDMNGADHIEAPPFASPRRMRVAPDTANEMAAPAPAAPAAKPAAARAKQAPLPTPTPSPTPRAR
jgi:hypothetical protein